MSRSHRLFTPRAATLAALLGAASAGCSALLAIADVGYGAPDAGGDAGLDEELAAREGGEDAAFCKDADVVADPLNCGACRHDCLGGACTGGLCQPYLIAVANHPRGIGVDGAEIYFATDREVLHHSTRAGSEVPKSLAANQSEPEGLAITLRGIYWTTNEYFIATGGSLSFATRQGQSSVLVSPAPASFFVEARGGAVFWNLRAQGDGGDSIMWIHEDGGTEAGALRGLGSTFGLAMDDERTYWTEPSKGIIHYCDRPACAMARTLLSSEPGARAITVRGSRLYWVRGFTLKSCTLPACADETTLASQGFGTTTPEPGKIAVDDDYVYGSGTDGATLVRCSVAGCGGNPEVVATANQPFDIALDDAGVYWSSFAAPDAGGGIFGKAK